MCLRATIEKISYENSFDFDAEGIFVESDAVTIDESGQGTIGSQLFRSADRETAFFHQPETVGELERQLYIMG